jgi:hypothetical protein
MQLENEAHDLERIAKAFRLISKEISSGGLANALLGIAIENSGAVRGSVLLSGELLAKANASFPRKKAQRRAYPRCKPRGATPPGKIREPARHPKGGLHQTLTQVRSSVTLL